MGDYVWEPNSELVAEANVTRLMRSCGFEVDANDLPGAEAVTRAFVRKTQRDVAWFWERALADMAVDWEQPYSKVIDLEGGPEFADWFVGGTLNIVANCVDRHAAGPLADKVALTAEGEDGTVREFSYAELAEEVQAVASALVTCGVEVGDRVACYLPMIAEAAIAMLATQKVGAVFVPIFSGYAAPAVRERLEDAGVKLVFTSDAACRRGVQVPLKAQLDGAVDGLNCVHTVLVFARGSEARCPMTEGRDRFVADVPATQCATRMMPAMAPALMLFTSGTTGRPKATVHSHAGCLAQMGKELCYNFDLKRGDVFFWFSDIGWMMGPWEIIGVLMHGGSLVLFEGAPDYPSAARLWETVERHEVTTLGLSPTAVRLLMRAGDDVVGKYSMPSLRLLGSTGEAWDEVSYQWYFKQVGRSRCPVINISGGTDIVGCFLAPLPTIRLRAGSLQSPGLGMDVDVFDEEGHSLLGGSGEVGYLVCKQPAPSMTRGLWGNRAKYLQTYWSKFPGVWNHGDWARVDADGQWFVLGRADDTMKIAGRRVGPGEIEAALIAHPAVSEAAAVGIPDELKGTDVACFVVLHPGQAESEGLRASLVRGVVDSLGKVDRPAFVRFVDELPKTRSGKILRRFVARWHCGEGQEQDCAAVANPDALLEIGRAR